MTTRYVLLMGISFRYSVEEAGFKWLLNSVMEDKYLKTKTQLLYPVDFIEFRYYLIV